MKRKLIGLFCACILLSGCRDSSAQTVPTESPATEIQVTDPVVTDPPVARLPLLEQGIAVDESGKLLYIPNETLDEMELPDMHLLGNGLLLSEYRNQELILKHISLEDGALLASGSVPAIGGTRLFIGSGEIGICDSVQGVVTILDENLQVLRTYPVDAEGEGWYLNPELDTLYIFNYDRGVLVRNLETGEEYFLVDNGFEVVNLGSSTGYVVFKYTDREDQRTYTRCLNLSTATLETVPVNGSYFSGIRLGETWLFQEEVEYVLVNGESASSFTWNEFDVRLTAPRHHLLAQDNSRRHLTLFDTDGAFLTECSLPDYSDAITGLDFIWSGYWEGYFFTDYMDSSCRLMFWDVDADTAGENLQLLPLDSAQKSEPVVEAELYERAEELSHRFGVDIRIAEQCSLNYTHFESYEVTDPVYIRSGLDTLEHALSQYPEGFFKQLLYGTVESIRFELVGGLWKKENVDDRPDSIAAFAQNRGSYYLIALEVFVMQEKTLYHEISHIIDKRLEWDAQLRPGALYNEQTWMSLQPEGFQYAMSYTNTPAELDEYLHGTYFVSDYSMTYPTEDRAELMEAAMDMSHWAFQSGSGRREKMQYYADCIRDCFDTDGWPETTVWEEVLQ